MPAQNQFSNTAEGLDSPAFTQIAVTPNDSVDLPYFTRGIYCGGAGTLTVTPIAGGANVTYTVGAGAILPIVVSRVLATGTTATGIVAWS